ncbi:hypothetical protein [Deinococcus sp.]|uniref:hypothetical protein n=1 Tax=Deinococcus sp. TaxID=47478 RepID=UPI0025C740CF|nr:hypothetical protein [Deinococcus sp.]
MRGTGEPCVDGNARDLKEVERVLGVCDPPSVTPRDPTVRAHFDTPLRPIGSETELADPHAEVLSSLERGEITPEEAARKLRR